MPGPVRLEAAVAADGYLRTRVSDRGRWRQSRLTTAERGQGLSVAAQFAEELQVSHPQQDAGRPGATGRGKRLRYLRRELSLRGQGDLAAYRDDAAVVAFHGTHSDKTGIHGWLLRTRPAVLGT
ncbi:MAG TPA: hypothetical protein VF838_07550 [Trebonia sp.]